MDRVKQFYQVTFLGEESALLSPDEFKQLQEECREIYEYDKPAGAGLAQGWYCNDPRIKRPPSMKELLEVKPELTVPDPAIEAVSDNREKLLEKSAHKGIREVVKTAMAVDALKERVDKMEPSNSKKDITPYVKMHEDGLDMLAIKNQMIKDEFCATNSIPYFSKKILAASTRVTKIEQPVESDDEKINRLKAQNKAEAKDRQQPKMVHS